MMIIVTDGGSRHGSLSAEKLISDFLDLLINEISLFLSIFSPLLDISAFFLPTRIMSEMRFSITFLLPASTLLFWHTRSKIA